MGEVAKVFKKYNIALLQEEFFVPRSCEYYLHFNINLPYPEKELEECIQKIDEHRKTIKKKGS